MSPRAVAERHRQARARAGAAAVLAPPGKPLTIIESLRSPAHLGALPRFRDLATWRAWLVALKAIYGVGTDPSLAMDAEELAIFQRHTGRAAPNPAGYPEAVLIGGRQSGKTAIAAAILDHEAVNAPPDAVERYACLVAQDERASLRTGFAYAAAPFRLPAWKPVVRARMKTALTLANNVTLAAYPCRPEALRGVISVCVVCDELAFFTSTEGRPTDREMVRAVRPSLATTGGKLIILSSPYAATGALYDLHARYWGQDAATALVW